MFAKNRTSSRAIERMFFYQKASGNSPNAVRMAFKGLSVKPVAHAFPVGVAPLCIVCAPPRLRSLRSSWLSTWD